MKNLLLFLLAFLLTGSAAMSQTMHFGYLYGGRFHESVEDGLDEEGDDIVLKREAWTYGLGYKVVFPARVQVDVSAAVLDYDDPENPQKDFEWIASASFQYQPFEIVNTNIVVLRPLGGMRMKYDSRSDLVEYQPIVTMSLLTPRIEAWVLGGVDLISALYYGAQRPFYEFGLSVALIR